MRLRLATLALALVAAPGCYFDVDELELPADLGVPDLPPDLTGVDLNTDGPRCGNGALPYHFGELSDAPLDRWGAEALMPITVSDATTTVLLDPARRTAGDGSLRLDTNNGVAGLVYPVSRDGNFDLSQQLYVSFTATADNVSPANDPGWKGAQPHLLLVSGATDYFEYIPDDDLLPRTPGPMIGVTVPLDGGFGWTRNKLGTPDLHHIQYLALTFDSWGAGFTVWIDDLRIGPNDFIDCPQ